MENPYEPPTSTAIRAADSRAEIKTRVARPATALIVMSSVQSVFLAIYLVSAIIVTLRGGTVSDGVLGVAVGCVQFATLIVICVGAAKLGHLKSFTVARFGAVLACIPFITPFVFIGIPFGIWSLRLLADPLVREAFIGIVPPREA